MGPYRGILALCCWTVASRVANMTLLECISEAVTIGVGYAYRCPRTPSSPMPSLTKITKTYTKVVGSSLFRRLTTRRCTCTRIRGNTWLFPVQLGTKEPCLSRFPNQRRISSTLTCRRGAQNVDGNAQGNHSSVVSGSAKNDHCGQRAPPPISTRHHHENVSVWKGLRLPNETTAAFH